MTNAGKRIDDAAEQDRLDEHRRGKRQVGDGQRPAQAGLAAEQFEHADIEANKFHEPDIGEAGNRPLAKTYSNAMSDARNADG